MSCSEIELLQGILNFVLASLTDPSPDQGCHHAPAPGSRQLAATILSWRTRRLIFGVQDLGLGA